MFDAIAPKYDRLNRIISFRLDVRWRKRAVRDLAVARGRRVLDLASGTGDLCIDLARVGVRPISMDLSFGMLSADRSGAPRVQTDILRLPVPDGSVDGVTCGFALRNLADLPTFFAELGRVVRPGGRIALLDVSTPAQPGHPLGQQHLLRPRRAADRCAAVRRRRLPLPAQERGLPAVARRDGGQAAQRPGSPTSSTRQLTGGLTQLMVATPVARVERGRTDACSRSPRPARRGLTRRRRSTSTTSPAATATLFVRDGVGVAGRGTAARFDVDDGDRARSPSIEHDSTVDGSRTRRASASCRSGRAPACGLLVPEFVVRKSAEHPPTITVVGDRPSARQRPARRCVAWLGFGSSRTARPTP